MKTAARPLAAAIALAAVLFLGSPPPAQAVGLPASRSGYCTTADTNAVTVVIDFGDLGGGTHVFCATGLKSGATGMDALRAAGISVTGTQQNGSGIVCRLQGKPTASQTIGLPGDPGYQEKCVDTPPSGAYWSYWSASAGGSWSYNSRGLLANRVKLGGYEGWSFSHGSRRAPGVTPSVHNAPKPTVAPKPKPTVKPKPTATAKPKPTVTAKPKPTTTAKPKPTVTAKPKPTTTKAPSATTKPAPEVSPSAITPSAPAATPVTVIVTPTADDPADATPTDAGLPAGLIAGIAAIVVIAAGAGVVAVRRRRRS